MARTWTSRKKKRGVARNDPFARSDAIAARRVLRDCHFALRELQAADTSVGWRILWIATITLLRSVGHVLDKVDGKRSRHLRSAVDAVWSDIKIYTEKHLIFFEFIERERNITLKEYDFGSRIAYPVDESGPKIGVHKNMLFGGDLVDQTDLVRQAIAWWERLLGRVELQADDSLRVELAQRKKKREYRRNSRVAVRSLSAQTTPSHQPD